MIKGFRDFIARGNVVDLAVAVVIGAAFGSVITSLVDNVINPLIAGIAGEPDMSNVLVWTLRDPGPGSLEEPTVLALGAFLTAVLNFLIIAAAIYFIIVMPLNKLAERRKKDEAAVDEAASPTEIELLTEIRDALRAQSKP